MFNLFKALSCSVSVLALAGPVYAQEAPPSRLGAESASDAGAIIVTARRRDEDVQDVPVVVDAVSAEDIAELNLQDFREVQALVPGLNLRNEANGIGSSAQIRGVAFDINASTQPSVDFYFNDSPIDGPHILQQMYDIAQIEVSRGPQGTLRGRSSPSGAISVTTHKPSLTEWGGNISLSASDLDALNLNGGIGGPLIEGVLGVRVAGIFNANQVNSVSTIDGSIDRRHPDSETTGGRVSAVFEPLDWLRFEGVYQHADVSIRNFDQYASFSLVNPAAPVSPVLIRPEDRLSIQESPRVVDQVFDVFNWRSEARFAGQRLIYQGQHAKFEVDSRSNADPADAFNNRDIYQTTNTVSTLNSHEIRLQNEGLVFDMFDYVAGYFYQKRVTPTNLTQQTAVLLPSFLGGGIAAVVDTQIKSPSQFEENSFFGSVTAHVGDRLQLSAGARYIEFSAPQAFLTIGSNTLAGARPIDENHVIYNLSAQYFINPDVMVYASTGTSRRPGPTIVGNFSPVQSDLQRSFTFLDTESSTSYELGIKTELFDSRVRLNVTGFYQEFENYAYKLSDPVNFQTFTFVPGTGLVPGIGISNQFAANVPLTVKGIEAQLSFSVTPHFDISMVAAYADGQIKNGLIPCDDLNRDGTPDNLTSTPTLAQIQAAYGTNYIGACRVSQRSSSQSPFSATISASYTLPLSDNFDFFARGLLSFLGDSQNIPSNQFDDVSAYGLLNLFAGFRDPDGAWELNFYARNVLDSDKVTSFGPRAVTSFQRLQPPTFQTTAGDSVTSSYSQINTVAPREFGLNLRFAFGSR